MSIERCVDKYVRFSDEFRAIIREASEELAYEQDTTIKAAYNDLLDYAISKASGDLSNWQEWRAEDCGNNYEKLTDIDESKLDEASDSAVDFYNSKGLYCGIPNVQAGWFYEEVAEGTDPTELLKTLKEADDEANLISLLIFGRDNPLGETEVMLRLPDILPKAVYKLHKTAQMAVEKATKHYKCFCKNH